MGIELLELRDGNHASTDVAARGGAAKEVPDGNLGHRVQFRFLLRDLVFEVSHVSP